MVRYFLPLRGSYFNDSVTPQAFVSQSPWVSPHHLHLKMWAVHTIRRRTSFNAWLTRYMSKSRQNIPNSTSLSMGDSSYSSLAVLPLFTHFSPRNLSAWAENGVLMLNTCLTVRQGNSNSHADKGWEIFRNVLSKWSTNMVEQIFQVQSLWRQWVWPGHCFPRMGHSRCQVSCEAR